MNLCSKKSYIRKRMLLRFTTTITVCHLISDSFTGQTTVMFTKVIVAFLGLLAAAVADPNVFDDIETGLNHLMGKEN
ncbi:hypothetical protein CEXT_228611 [Caerostris extrusa]|uniref:Uncharacterized protein n=1 Tax=Caerostris extrusa TaxID=172846 RepID=A0AAV4VRD1_CAEEX|nr:hypothetical protein CEXT_228611 [Caerostris extrusa]